MTRGLLRIFLPVEHKQSSVFHIYFPVIMLKSVLSVCKSIALLPEIDASELIH